jgi:hypothetical protein
MRFGTKRRGALATAVLAARSIALSACSAGSLGSSDEGAEFSSGRSLPA